MKNKQQLSYTEYENRIDSLRKSEKISAESIGKSIMGRHIQKLEIGLGEKKILLLGGACGDSESADTLLSFAEEFAASCSERKRMCGTNPSYVSLYRKLVIYPLLNPDALEYRRIGLSEDNPIRDRLLAMNLFSEDFSEWKANGRGVSLERNSPIGFEKRKAYENAREIFNGSPCQFSGNTPESEPELCALINDILKYEKIKALVQISKGKDGIYTPVTSRTEGKNPTLKSMLRICGMRRASDTEEDNGIVDLLSEKYGVCVYKISSERCDLKNLRDLLYTLPVIL